jgi:hypothetical protein
VFGDSFANKDADQIWWRYLETQHGHQVRCFGEPGSALSFSLDKLDAYHSDFDHVIWCVTSVNRISFWHRDRAYHHTGTSEPMITGDAILDAKRDITHRYLTMAFETHFAEIQGRALVHWAQSQYHNITIVPCFATPVYFMAEPGFNLFDLCLRELAAAFPNRDPASIVNSDLDQRQGHLTETNHRVLAALLAQRLEPGVFTARYEDFVLDDSLITQFGA